MKKKTFVLFELLIAFSLMGILLSFLFSYLVQTMKLEKKMETLRERVFEREKLQITLQNLFLSLTSDSTLPALYIDTIEEEKNPSLIAYFDHGIDPDPLFSGKVMARIYLDPQKNLKLALFPIQEEGKQLWREEILAKNVKSYAFSFFDGKDKSEPLWKERLTKKDTWVPQEIKLSIQRQEDPLLFSFHLMTEGPIASY